MDAEKRVHNHEHSGFESKTCESAIEIAVQNMVSVMARLPSNRSDFASISKKVISDVNETECVVLVSELEDQSRNVKNTSVNVLAMDHPLCCESFVRNMEVKDEQSMIGRPYISSAGYHIRTLSDDGTETVHFFPWDSDEHRPRRCVPKSSNSNAFSSASPNRPNCSQKILSNLHMRPRQVPCILGKSSYHFRPHRPKECHPDMRSVSPLNHHQCGDASNKLSNNFRVTSLQSYKGNKDSDLSKEVICGPRAVGLDDSVQNNESEEDLPYFSRRKNFNLPDFQTEYENAKFYIIKSFGEDNVHKSLKYGVWSSTPYGNEKLEAAYHEAKAKGIETGKQCPIFFFFSVNRSGKFLGVAEMIGRVDFNKDLDFWQLDKWSGFFPVKWHILKDIPHSELCHIILKENDSRAVTYTRDTQEVGLGQGIEMLKIFKNYSAKTSLLDDFFFYENREKLRAAQRKSEIERKQLEKYGFGNYRDEDAAGSYGKRNIISASCVDMTSRTRNLSLNSRS